MRKFALKLIAFQLVVFALIMSLAGCDNGQKKAYLEEALEKLIMPSTIRESDNYITPQLPAGYEDINISIRCSKPEVVDSEGKISRTQQEETVTVTVVLSIGNVKVEKDFTYTISAHISVTQNYLDGILNSLTLPSVTQTDITLPTIDTNQHPGVTLTFSSTNTEIITNEGKVYPLIEIDVDVVVNITAKKGTVTRQKSFTIKVKGRELSPDQRAVRDDINALKLPIATITNLDLPTTGANGSTITWTTSNAEKIDTTGVISRAESSDARVTLTATVTKGDVTDSKAFDVTVLRTGSNNNGVFARASMNSQLFYLSLVDEEVWLEFEGIAWCDVNATTRKFEFAMDHSAGDDVSYTERPYPTGWFESLPTESPFEFKFKINLSAAYKDLDPAMDWIKFFIKVTEDGTEKYLRNGNNQNGLSSCITGDNSWPSGNTGDLTLQSFTDKYDNTYALRVNWSQIYLFKNPA